MPAPPPPAEASAGRAAVSALAPLRRPLFRAIWLASLFSNFGTWVQSVGAAWLMTSITPAPDMVALVQAASSLPVLLFSLAAGALADLWDRRLQLLTAQLWMLASASLLAALTAAHWVTPWLLLALTFSIGLGNSLNGPAWQASVTDLVPREEVPAAVALNAAGFNIARSAGPALGGLIVGAAGPEAAFLFNAVSYVALILVLAGWRRAEAERPPREPLARAILDGLRYAFATPTIRVVLIRAGAFGFCSGAGWALLPVVASQEIGGGPLTYGLLLGALGVGAVVGGFGVVPVRRRFGAEIPVRLGILAFGLTTLTLATVAALPPLLAALMMGGAAWMTTLSTFNITIQLCAAAWVKARTFAIYQMIAFGGLALGSAFWGWVAELSSVSASLLAAAATMFASLALGLRYRLPRAS